MVRVPSELMKPVVVISHGMALVSNGTGRH